MTKKLARHGNSLALIIEKPLLRMLNITEATELELFIENNTLIIKPITKSKKHNKKEIKAIAQEIMDQYAEVFKKLAK